jgi:TrpR family trp operon transcriptional repressor
MMGMVALEKIVQEIRKVKTDKELKTLILGLLTSGEIEEVAQRIEIVRMLKQGVAQHEIAARLGVGVATVTRGAKEIKLGRFNNL